jgi:hypothetical protein
MRDLPWRLRRGELSFGRCGAQNTGMRSKWSLARGAMLLAVVVSAASCGGSSSDTTTPGVAISAPANFASGIAGMLTFSATATDNVGVANVEFQVDGVAAGAAQTSAPYSVSVDTNSYASGQHVLRARANDAAGNQSAWASVTVSFGRALQLALARAGDSANL